MPQLPGLDRFTKLLQNAFRNRGPWSPTLLDDVRAVWDLGTDHPEFDDQIAYWCSVGKSQPALAGNFSTVWWRCSAGRAIVDGVSIVGQAATTNVALNVSSSATALAGAGTVASFLTNGFAVRAGFAQPQTLGVIDINTNTSVGGIIGGVGYGVMVPISGAQYSWRAGGIPPFLINAGTVLVAEPTAVNVGLSIAAWGRWWPEADTV